MATEFPVSDVLDVAISRETLFPSAAGFGTMAIAGTADVIDHGERVRYYGSVDEVAADFIGVADSEELKAATAGFSQDPKPERIGIARVLTADASGFVKGGEAATPATFELVGDGSFTLSIDGVEQDITGADFSGDADLDAVAATLQVAIRAIGTGGFTNATVTASGGRLKIASGTAGAASSVSPLTPTGGGTDLSGPSYINALADVAGVIDGHTFVDLSGELSAIEDRDDDWHSLALTRDLKSNANYLAAAVWCEARRKILAAFDDSLIALDSTSVLDLPFLLKAGGYNRTFCHWSSDASNYPEVSTLAKLATVDYTIPNSSITLKFKRLPGITPVSINTSQRKALIAKNAEIYVTRGGVNMLEEGKMASGEFIDIIHGVDWMNTTIAIEVFAEMYGDATKVAMTDTGVARLQQKVKGVLETATEADLLASDFDDNQKLLPAYTIATKRVLDHPLTERAERDGPPITFEGRISGAVHFQTVRGVVTV